MSDEVIDRISTTLAKLVILGAASIWLWNVDALSLSYFDSLCLVGGMYAVISATQVKRDRKYRDD